MQPFSVIIIQSQTHLPGISRKKEVQTIYGIEVGFRFKIHEAILLPKKSRQIRYNNTPVIQTKKHTLYLIFQNFFTYVAFHVPMQLFQKIHQNISFYVTMKNTCKTSWNSFLMDDKIQGSMYIPSWP